jgi:glutaconate CoA-transferase, subunit B
MEKSYDKLDLMIICAARLLPESGTVFAYGKLHLQAAILARHLHGEGSLNILTPYGFLDESWFSGRSEKGHLGGYRGSMLEAFEFMQAGYVDVGFVEGEEVDRYGNVNGWMAGSVKKPKEIFGGGGIGCDTANLANCTYIMAPVEYLRKCSFITAPGHLKGGKSRFKEGLHGEGPRYVITNLCVFDFHPKSKKARVYALFPGVSKKEVVKKIGWKAIWPKKIPETYVPSREELIALQRSMLE